MKTTAIMKYIPAAQIRANRRRNFTLNPLRTEQVNNLIESYGRNGQKEALSVRANPDGTYELSAGHHRLAAMGGLVDLLPTDFAGEVFTPPQGVRCLVEDMDEDQMVRWMIDENSTQPGAMPGVDVDSIAAVVHRVAYLLISGADCPEWMLRDDTPRSGEYPSDLSWRKAKAHLESGSGLGVPIIRAYGVGGMSKHRVEQAVANLKALETGGMADIIKDARQEYEAEVAEAEAEEAKRLEEIKRQQVEEERQRKEAAKRRADLERQRKEAEAAKDLARQKAVAELKAKAEREEKERHARNEAERIRQERIRQERAAAQQVEQERLRKAREAEEKMRQQAREKGVHISLLNAMNGHELKFFRDAASPAFTVDEQPALWKDTERALAEIPPIGREAHRKEVLIPVYIAGRAELRGKLRDFFPNEAEHHALVVNAIETVRSGTGEPTVREQEIVALLNRERNKRDAQTKAQFEQWRAEEEAQKWNKKADRVMSEMGTAVGRAAAAAREVDLLFKEAKDDIDRRRLIMRLAQTTSLRQNTYALKGALKALEHAFNLYENSVDYEQVVASVDPAAYDGSVVDTQ
jgi:hypothetical protein